jgi:hypothetical protein
MIPQRKIEFAIIDARKQGETSNEIHKQTLDGSAGDYGLHRDPDSLQNHIRVRGVQDLCRSAPDAAFTILMILTIAWDVVGLLCLVNLRIGYLLAVILGVLNLFPLVLLVMGIAPFQDRPYFNGWITLVVDLLWLSGVQAIAAMAFGKRNAKQEGGFQLCVK